MCETSFSNYISCENGQYTSFRNKWRQGGDVLYNVNDLIVDILGKDNPSLKGSDGDASFQADELFEA